MDCKSHTNIPSSITYSNPLSSVSDISGANRAFNITVDQTVNVTWYINGIQVQFNESVIDAAYTIPAHQRVAGS